jgi:hypothetical protein
MDISIIKHERKSLLFNTGKPWTKKDSAGLFDVTMGSHDGADICELVGLFILNHISKKFGKENIGLYRDDGLALIKIGTLSVHVSAHGDCTVAKGFNQYSVASLDLGLLFLLFF